MTCYDVYLCEYEIIGIYNIINLHIRIHRDKRRNSEIYFIYFDVYLYESKIIGIYNIINLHIPIHRDKRRNF